MALPTDDIDIRKAFLTVVVGGNGDYYPTIIFENLRGEIERSAVRVAMSGGKAPTDVKLAVTDLYKALEKHGLNKPPTMTELND